MIEIATIDWFGRWGHLFSLKTLLYLKDIFRQFSIKTSIVGTHLNRLGEAILS